MPTVLPKTKVKATRVNPRILLLYSLPKVGKTSSLAALDDCLILDAENGADMYEAMRVSIGSTKDINDTRALIIAEGQANGGKYPYKYLALDTIDKLEEFAEVSATAKYKRSVIGSSFKGDSVLELPKGLGYYYLRNEVMLIINQLAALCPHLILVSHVKEKILEKGGVEVSSRDISLGGKLSQIVCSMADAIGYMYRDGKKLMINFETYEGAIMGARYPHLAGKTFEFGWDKIYLNEETKAA